MECSTVHSGGSETSYKAVIVGSTRRTRVGHWQWKWREMGGFERY